MNKKAEGLSIRQIVGIIISLIFIVLFVIFWKDIPGWLKSISDRIYAPIAKFLNLSPGPRL